MLEKFGEMLLDVFDNTYDIYSLSFCNCSFYNKKKRNIYKTTIKIWEDKEHLIQVRTNIPSTIAKSREKDRSMGSFNHIIKIMINCAKGYKEKGRKPLFKTKQKILKAIEYHFHIGNIPPYNFALSSMN